MACSFTTASSDACSGTVIALDDIRGYVTCLPIINNAFRLYLDEVDLILSRQHIYVRSERFTHICQNHRDSLGIQWRSKSRCTLQHIKPKLAKRGLFWSESRHLFDVECQQHAPGTGNNLVTDLLPFFK